MDGNEQLLVLGLVLAAGSAVASCGGDEAVILSSTQDAAIDTSTDGTAHEGALDAAAGDATTFDAPGCPGTAALWGDEQVARRHSAVLHDAGRRVPRRKARRRTDERYRSIAT